MVGAFSPIKTGRLGASGTVFENPEQYSLHTLEQTMKDLKCYILRRTFNALKRQKYKSANLILGALILTLCALHCLRHFQTL